MATIVKTTPLNNGDEVFVKGTKGRQTMLYIGSWNEYQRKLGVVGAEKDFDRSVEEFFAPLTAAAEALRESYEDRGHDSSRRVVRAGTDAVEGSETEYFYLRRDALIWEDIVVNDGANLVWVGDNLLALKA